MLLSEVSAEYYLVCEAKGFTPKTMKNKRQELRQLFVFLEEKRAVTRLESVSNHDLKAYVRHKQQSGLQPQSVVSLEGIEEAKKRGVYKGRPKKYTEKNKGLNHAIELFNNRSMNKMTVNEIAAITKISRATLYRAVK